jgi:dUTP pyrophosphatase
LVDVYVQKLTNTEIPSYAYDTDAGMDVRAVEDVIIPPGGTALVKTGLAVAIPEGYEIQVRPRSGCSAKTKLRIANAPGTIDAGYRGELCIIVDNTSRDYYWKTDTEIQRIPESAVLGINGKEITPDTAVSGNHGYYKICKGDRIAQIVLCAVSKANLIPCSDINDVGGDGRQASGFGSSGVK